MAAFNAEFGKVLSADIVCSNNLHVSEYQNRVGLHGKDEEIKTAHQVEMNSHNGIVYFKYRFPFKLTTIEQIEGSNRLILHLDRNHWFDGDEKGYGIDDGIGIILHHQTNYPPSYSIATDAHMAFLRTGQLKLIKFQKDDFEAFGNPAPVPGMPVGSTPSQRGYYKDSDPDPANNFDFTGNKLICEYPSAVPPVPGVNNSDRFLHNVVDQGGYIEMYKYLSMGSSSQTWNLWYNKPPSTYDTTDVNSFGAQNLPSDYPNGLHNSTLEEFESFYKTNF